MSEDLTCDKCSLPAGNCVCGPPWAYETLVHDVPFALGTEVRLKNDKEHVWRVFDHHGVTWEQGEDVDRVVLERWTTCPDHGGHDRNCSDCCQGVPIQHWCTWDDIEVAE